MPTSETPSLCLCCRKHPRLWHGPSQDWLWLCARCLDIELAIMLDDLEPVKDRNN